MGEVGENVNSALIFLGALASGRHVGVKVLCTRPVFWPVPVLANWATLSTFSTAEVSQSSLSASRPCLAGQ
jgi:hypothetical protein